MQLVVIVFLQKCHCKVTFSEVPHPSSPSIIWSFVKGLALVLQVHQCAALYGSQTHDGLSSFHGPTNTSLIPMLSI